MLTWNQVFWGSIVTGITYCYWSFCFHIVKPLMRIMALLQISGVSKNLYQLASMSYIIIEWYKREGILPIPIIYSKHWLMPIIVLVNIQLNDQFTFNKLCYLTHLMKVIRFLIVYPIQLHHLTSLTHCHRFHSEWCKWIGSLVSNSAKAD